MTEIKFYLPNSTTPYPFITAKVNDFRNYLTVNLDIPSTKFVNAQLFISKQTSTSNLELPDSFTMKLGKNSIGNPDVVKNTADIQYKNSDGSGKFVNNTVYSIKIKAVLIDENNVTLTYFAKFADQSSYSFLFRSDGGDKFKNAEVNIMNEQFVDSSVGSSIILKCPIDFVNVNDTRTPNRLSFSFEEVNSYAGRPSVHTDLSILSMSLPYQSSGIYNLVQTETKKLIDDSAYFISVIAIYNDGYNTTTWFSRKLHVIKRPSIESVVAYGFGSDQSDADELAVSSVMNLYMFPTTVEQINLPSANGDITFYLSQNGVLMYKSIMPVNPTVLNGTILYTVLKANLVKVWTTTPPTQNPNGSYTYDVSAKIEHLSVNAGETVPKESVSFSKIFTSDIVPLANVFAVNAWVAGTNVDGAGDRTVDISNATTASGYDLAPELGIVGKFYKNDLYGTGSTDGFFKDLDAAVNGVPVTNHRFTVNVNGGAAVPVTVLHQLQGYGTKTDQEMYIELFQSLNNGASANKYTNANGLFRNLPGPANTIGSLQKPIYFLIPNAGLFAQTNNVKVNIAIEPPAGETTRPSATQSNAVVVVPKVNKYEMAVGTASEPRFTQNTLTVPINNSTATEPYFASAIFTSDNSAPNALKEVAVSNNGVFDIDLVNPSIRGANCNYQVRYKITDPNAQNGTITGPISATYSVPVYDPPTLDNFSVSGFSYNTFNDNAISKFNFNIAFQTVGTKYIDGVFVYFQSTNDDADASNDIPLTLLMDVKRSDGDSQSNLSYTLQTTAAADASLAEGVKIIDKNGVATVNKWLNFRSGDIVFKPYKFIPNFAPDIIDLQTVKKVHNIPVIPVATNVALTGGVKESYDATKSTWDNGLAAYASISSSVTPTYKLTLNGSDVSGQVSNHSYTVNLTPYAAGTALSLSLQIKLTAADSLVYYSKPIGIDFTVASVDASAVQSTVLRGSNNIILKVSRNDYVVSPSNGAVVSEVKLISNENGSTTNPTHNQVKVLTCSSTANSVQPVSPAVNEYNLAADSFADGTVLNLQYRLKAGVSYNLLSQYVNGTATSTVATASTHLFLALQSPILPYTVGNKPEIQIGSYHKVISSGTYAGRIAIDATINSKGFQAEGLQAVVFILSQESNLTAPTMSEAGVQHVIAFESSGGLTKSYTVGANASLLPSSTDNLGATEVHQMSVTDLAGFNEGNVVTHTLVMGNLLANDQSTLYLGANSSFNPNLPITVVAFVSTRLGSSVAINEVGPSAFLSNFSVPAKYTTDASFNLTVTSNSDGAITYSSSNTSVATVSGSTVTIVGAGTTTITATQAATAQYASNSISALLVVTVPPVLLLDSNGITINYIGNVANVPANTALFVQENPRGTGLEWFAVVKDEMKNDITNYAKGVSSAPFTPPGQTAVPFNNIVTTLMTDMVNIFESTTFNQAIESWNVTNVTNMHRMFYNGRFNKPISKWNTANVTDMSYMFFDCYPFNQDIGSWNMAKVKDINSMFANAAFNIDIGSWNTANVTDMNSMFYFTKFNQPINSWSTANVTNMSFMFQRSEFNQPIGSWNTINVKQMLMMFNEAPRFNQNINYNQTINSWNTSNVTNMTSMFHSATAFNQPVDLWNTANVMQMDSMFQSATAFNQPISSWNVINVMSIANMFNGSAFNQPIDSWNTANVVNMNSTFQSARAFNQPIGSWNTANVTSMIGMFSFAREFNQAIGSWNTANVTNINSMFVQANKFNQAIGSWNTAKVNNMSSMFNNASVFNQPIGSWNTASVISMMDMFNTASVFNQPIDSWNTARVVNMSYMFVSASAFNQPIGSWNTAKVYTMELMFQDATVFNQNISSWNVNVVSNYYNFRLRSALSIDNTPPKFR